MICPTYLRRGGRHLLPFPPQLLLLLTRSMGFRRLKGDMVKTGDVRGLVGGTLLSRMPSRVPEGGGLQLEASSNHRSVFVPSRPPPPYPDPTHSRGWG